MAAREWGRSSTRSPCLIFQYTVCRVDTKRRSSHRRHTSIDGPTQYSPYGFIWKSCEQRLENSFFQHFIILPYLLVCIRSEKHLLRTFSLRNALMKHFKEMSQFTGSAFHNKAAKQGSRAVKNREVNEGTAAKVESIKESLRAKTDGNTSITKNDTLGRANATLLLNERISNYVHLFFFLLYWMKCSLNIRTSFHT